MITQSKIEKRDLILETATRLFVERGFHATPTSAITKEAGMSAGILFHYFKTKDELITELYVSIKKEYNNSVLNGIEGISSKMNQLRLIWSNSIHWGLENPLKFRFLMQADNSTYAETIKNHPDIVAKHQMFNEFIQEFIDQKIIRDTNREFLMTTMFFLIVGTISYLTENPDLKSDNAFMEQAWEMFSNYFKP